MKVVAKLLPEDLPAAQEFQEIAERAAAITRKIKDLKKELVTIMEEANEVKSSFWPTIHKKYNLDPNSHYRLSDDCTTIEEVDNPIYNLLIDLLGAKIIK